MGYMTGVHELGRKVLEGRQIIMTLKIGAKSLRNGDRRRASSRPRHLHLLILVFLPNHDPSNIHLKQ
jgi:hypothetical protein